MSEELIQRCGSQILAQDKVVALDIGGAAGLVHHWNRILGNSSIYSFEPHEQSYKELLQLYSASPFKDSFHILPEALSGTGGLRTFYMLSTPTGSSIVPLDLTHPEVIDNPNTFPIHEKLIKTRTLQDVLDQYGVASTHMMKLDIQGAELEVIKSLDQARLDQMLLIELEIDLSDYYIGGTTFCDTQSYLKENGFKLFDTRTSKKYRRLKNSRETYNEKVFGVPADAPSISARLHEFDAIYFRDPLPLVARGDKEQLRKLMFVYCIYNFFSEAAFVLDHATENGIFTKAEHEQVQAALVAWHGFVKQELNIVEQILKATGNQVWCQYTWRPYPSF